MTAIAPRAHECWRQQGQGSWRCLCSAIWKSFRIRRFFLVVQETFLLVEGRGLTVVAMKVSFYGPLTGEGSSLKGRTACEVGPSYQPRKALLWVWVEICPGLILGSHFLCCWPGMAPLCWRPCFMTSAMPHQRHEIWCGCTGLALPSSQLPTTDRSEQQALAPQLFTLFVNARGCRWARRWAKFADTTKWFKMVTMQADCKEFQWTLSILAEWITKWHTRFNASKCKVIHSG